MRRWRAANRKRANAIAAACRKRNREKIADRWKIYYQKNKARLYEKKKAYLGRNPEKLKRWKNADYQRHRESYIARARRRWREKNDECRAYEAKRYRENKNAILARHQKYVEGNRDKLRAYHRAYKQSPRGHAVYQASDRRCAKRIAAYKKTWAERNREKLAAQSRVRFKTNLSFAMGVRLRTALAQALKKHRAARPDSITRSMKELVGCTLDDLVTYLEAKFQSGMCWDNRNLWHIDHIRPLASFDLTDVGQQRVAFHYTNLQPLWAIDNIRKGARTSRVECAQQD